LQERERHLAAGGIKAGGTAALPLPWVRQAGGRYGRYDRPLESRARHPRPLEGHESFPERVCIGFGFPFPFLFVSQ